MRAGFYKRQLGLPKIRALLKHFRHSVKHHILKPRDFPGACSGHKFVVFEGYQKRTMRETEVPIGNSGPGFLERP